MCNSVSHSIAHAVSTVVNASQFAHVCCAVEGCNLSIFSCIVISICRCVEEIECFVAFIFSFQSFINNVSNFYSACAINIINFIIACSYIKFAVSIAFTSEFKQCVVADNICIIPSTISTSDYMIGFAFLSAINVKFTGISNINIFSFSNSRRLIFIINSLPINHHNRICCCGKSTVSNCISRYFFHAAINYNSTVS